MIDNILLLLLKMMVRRSNCPIQTADKYYTLWKSLKEGCAWTQNLLQSVTCSSNKTERRNENLKNCSNLFTYCLGSFKHGVKQRYCEFTLLCFIVQYALIATFCFNGYSWWISTTRKQAEQQQNLALTNVILMSI